MRRKDEGLVHVTMPVLPGAMPRFKHALQVARRDDGIRLAADLGTAGEAPASFVAYGVAATVGSGYEGFTSALKIAYARHGVEDCDLHLKVLWSPQQRVGTPYEVLRTNRQVRRFLFDVSAALGACGVTTAATVTENQSGGRSAVIKESRRRLLHDALFQLTRDLLVEKHVLLGEHVVVHVDSGDRLDLKTGKETYADFDGTFTTWADPEFHLIPDSDDPLVQVADLVASAASRLLATQAALLVIPKDTALWCRKAKEFNFWYRVVNTLDVHLMFDVPMELPWLRADKPWRNSLQHPFIEDGKFALPADRQVITVRARGGPGPASSWARQREISRLGVW